MRCAKGQIAVPPLGYIHDWQVSTVSRQRNLVTRPPRCYDTNEMLLVVKENFSYQRNRLMREPNCLCGIDQTLVPKGTIHN